jgi:hypothetical protein
MEAALAGTPFKEIYDTHTKLETAYKTWLQTTGGTISRSGVQSANETDGECRPFFL